MKAADRLLTADEWLDAIGCDRAYKKDMKATYDKSIAQELSAQDAKTLEALRPTMEWAAEQQCVCWPYLCTNDVDDRAKWCITCQVRVVLAEMDVKGKEVA